MKSSEMFKASRVFVAGLVIGATVACNTDSQFLPSHGTKEIPVTNAPGKIIDAPGFNFDKALIQTLYQDLQRESGTREQRLSSIRDNLSRVLEDTGEGTSLMIDQNGTFLTVAHVLTKNIDGKTPTNTPIDSAHPKTGIVSAIKDMYLNLDRDIAVYSAPNGNSSKPTSNIQFKASPLNAGEKVWLMTLDSNKKTSKYDLHIESGSVVKAPADAPEYYRKFIFAKGIGEVAGGSGGVIVDKEGRVVGIYKGAAIDPNDQTYGLFVPISEIQTLINQSDHHSLPTKPN